MHWPSSTGQYSLTALGLILFLLPSANPSLYIMYNTFDFLLVLAAKHRINCTRAQPTNILFLLESVKSQNCYKLYG